MNDEKLTTMENPFEQPEKKQQRPTFLLVLCILTFIGSGWSVLSNLFSVFTSNVGDDHTELMMEMEQYSSEAYELGNWGIEFLNSSMEVLQMMKEHEQEMAVMQLILGLISLLGAILMFNLRRMGFYLYVTAQILMLFVLPYFVGFSLIVLLGMGASAFSVLLFILLYAVNLKHLH